MGSYTDNLTRRRRLAKTGTPTGRFTGERLTGVAIKRDGSVHFMVKGSHAQVRQTLGDDDIYTSTCGDIEGFRTSNDRFVTRDEAKVIGEQSGQCRPQRRELLSSDIDW